MKNLLTLFLLLFLTTAHAQPFFQERVGGVGAEAVHAMVKTTDGGFVMAGSTDTFGQDSGDVYVVKMTSAGAIQWTKTIGGPSMDRASDIIQTNDGGYAITGRTGYWEFGISVIKLDNLGNLQWSIKINYGLFDQGHAIIQTADGGYAIAASVFEPTNTTYPGILIKLNSAGIIQWQSYHNVFTEGAYSLVQTSDLKYVIGAFTQASGSNLLLSKVDSNGVVSWCRSIGGPGLEMATPGARLIRTNDNGYAYIGNTTSYGAGNRDLFIVKLNTAGVLEWSKAIGTPGNDFGNSIIQTNDHEFVACGTTYNANNTTDAYVAKLDSSGNLLWTNTFGGSGYEDGNAIAQLNDGSIVMAGSTTSYGNGSEIYIVKMDPSGNACGGNLTTGSSSSGGTSNTINYIGSPLNLTIVNGPASVSNGGVMNTICSCTIPVSVITSSSLTTCSGDSLQLITNTTPGNTYKWLLNGLPVSGANNSTLYTSLGGNYACIQSNACGADTSNTINIIITSLPGAKITSSGPTTFCSGGSVVLNAPVSSNKAYQWLKNNQLISGATSASYNANSSGNYKVKVTNLVNGCSKTTPSGTVVTVNSLPAATVTPLGPTTFCAGGNVTLQANNGSGLSYEWKKNGITISGANNSTYTVTNAGKYKVKTTNQSGCTKISNIVSVSVPCKTAELSKSENYRIYPNPSTGVFTIEMQYATTELIQLKVYDVVGREIINKTIDGTISDLDLSAFEDGIYTLHIFCDKTRISRELIKMAP